MRVPGSTLTLIAEPLAVGEGKASGDEANASTAVANTSVLGAKPGSRGRRRSRNKNAATERPPTNVTLRKSRRGTGRVARSSRQKSLFLSLPYDRFVVGPVVSTDGTCRRTGRIRFVTTLQAPR